MEHTIFLTFLMQVCESIFLYLIFITLSKRLKELEKNAVQVDHKDV